MWEMTFNIIEKSADKSAEKIQEKDMKVSDCRKYLLEQRLIISHN